MNKRTLGTKQLSAVIQESEQLFIFLEYCDNAGWIKNVDKKRIVDDYEKSKQLHIGEINNNLIKIKN